MAEDHAEPKVITKANGLGTPTESSGNPPKAVNTDNDPTDQAKIGNYWVSVSN